MTVGTVCSSPIHPCTICAGVADALILVRALDWRSVVFVEAGADFAVHTVGVTELGIRGHACTIVSVAYRTLLWSSGRMLTIMCTVEP